MNYKWADCISVSLRHLWSWNSILRAENIFLFAGTALHFEFIHHAKALGLFSRSILIYFRVLTWRWGRHTYFSFHFLAGRLKNCFYVREHYYWMVLIHTITNSPNDFDNDVNKSLSHQMFSLRHFFPQIYGEHSDFCYHSLSSAPNIAFDKLTFMGSKKKTRNASYCLCSFLISPAPLDNRPLYATEKVEWAPTPTHILYRCGTARKCGGPYSFVHGPF